MCFRVLAIKINAVTNTGVQTNIWEYNFNFSAEILRRIVGCYHTSIFRLFEEASYCFSLQQHHLYSCTLCIRVPVSAAHPCLLTPSLIGYRLSVSFWVAPVVGSSGCTTAFSSCRSKLLLKHPLIHMLDIAFPLKYWRFTKYHPRGWRMPPQLRALALAEAWMWFPAFIWWLTTTRDSRSRGSDSLPWSHRYLHAQDAYKCRYTHRHIHTWLN